MDNVYRQQDDLESRALDATLVVLALFFFATSGAGYLLPDEVATAPWRWLLAAIAPLLVLLASSLTVTRRFSLPTSSAGLHVLIPVCLAATLGVVGGLKIGGTSPAALAPGLGSTTQLLYAFLWVGVAAPFIEELFFRGTLQPLLYRHTGRFGAVIITALLFMAAHLGAHDILLLFVLGAGFGTIACLAGSVWPAVAAHTAWNTATILAGVSPAATQWIPSVFVAGAVLTLVAWACLKTRRHRT